MERSQSDTFLARWLNNELTPSELREFEKSPDYLLYKKIADKSLEFSAPDFNKKEVFAQVQTKLASKKKGKVRSLAKRLSYVAAASVVLTFAILFFNDATKEYTANKGEKLAIVLPDNSKVLLNANSSISFNEVSWNEDRTVELHGEAYFEVEKGSTFTVKTEEGEVAVLGTKFNVRMDHGLFEVICYEGKVQANSHEDSALLMKGNAFRKLHGFSSEKWEVLRSEPTWKKGESSFKSVPLKHVIKALENQYAIAFDMANIDSNERFTGSFTHHNLETALQTVFVPMKIDVTFSGKKTVVLEAMNE